jgi:hypothetical protein
MAGNIFLPILSTFNGAGVRQAQGALSGLAGTVRGLGASFKAAAVGFVAFQSVSGLANFATGTIVEARDLERNIRALGLIFDEATPRMEAFARSANGMGLSTSEAAKAATFLGSTLRGAGFDTQRTADETERLVALAADLATVYGYDVSEALSGMTALFRGEYDPIEKFGVAMKQNEVNTALAAKGLGNLTGQQLLNAQQQVRLELLYQRTTRAQGAFAQGAGTLFVEQKKLESAFKDFEALLGARLTPVITEFMMELQPMLEGGTPAAENFFQGIADVMDGLLPLMQPIGDLFNIIVDVLGDLMIAFAPILETFSVLGAEVGNFVMPVFEVLAETLSFIAQVVSGILSPALDILSIILIVILRLVSKFLGMFEPIVAPIMGFFKMLGIELDRTKNGIHDVFNEIVNGQNSVATSSGFNTTTLAGIMSASATGPATPQTGTEKTAAKNYVADFYANIKDEIKKQNARLRLENLGASEALISSILSGQGWGTVYARVVKGGAAGIAELQKQFNQTKAGLDELAAAAEAAQKEFEAMQEAMAAVDEEVAKFGNSMMSLLKATAPLPTVTRTLGEFEQAVVEAFDAISGSLADAVDNKLLFQSSADDLAAYAKATQATLSGIAAQRDAIAARIADANDLIASTKNAVLGFANITSLLESQSQTIVETTMSVVDGIRLTLTRSLDVQGLVGDLTGNFQKVLDKTKKFAADLKELRRLGLDKNLFKQIVDAGLESGGATAAAIIAGGGETVAELNSVFAELSDVGAVIAEETAQVMFGAGVDVTNGLIEGLLSQDNALRQAAEVLAESFTTTFNSRMSDFMLTDAYALAGLTPNMTGLEQPTADGGGGRGVMFTAASTGPAKIFEVNINAGMVTDKAELGQTIVDTISRYERTNGSVWVRA